MKLAQKYFWKMLGNIAELLKSFWQHCQYNGYNLTNLLKLLKTVWLLQQVSKSTEMKGKWCVQGFRHAYLECRRFHTIASSSVHSQLLNLRCISINCIFNTGSILICFKRITWECTLDFSLIIIQVFLLCVTWQLHPFCTHFTNVTGVQLLNTAV